MGKPARPKRKSAPKPPKYQKEAQQLIRLWQGRLQLDEWTFKLVWVKEDDNEATIATVFPDHVYLTARIEVRPRWARRTKAEREQTMVHEMVHALLQELADKGHQLLNGKLVTRLDLNESVERATERLANAILWSKR